MSMTPRAHAAALAFILPLLTWATPALAQGAARLIPYQGFLERDGGPLTGNAALVFFLVDTVDAPRTSALWTETHAQVPVQAGRFSVALGEVTPIPNAVWQRPNLFLGVLVDGAELVGRQRVLWAPNAINAALAQNFNVSGALTVAGTTTVTGRTTLNGGATVAGGATVTGGADISGGATVTGGANVTGNSVVTGNLAVSGVVRSACSTGTSRVGPWCISNTVRPAANWDNASNTCEALGMAICPLAALMTCDSLNATRGSDCFTVTDGNTWLWTSDIGNADDVNAYNVLRVFNGAGNDATNEADLAPAVNTYSYYCCGFAGAL